MNATKMNRAPTSASNLARRAACPGSEAAESPFSEKDSEWSSEGVLLHSMWFADKNPALITPDQLELVIQAQSLARRFFTEFCNARGIPEDAAYVDEKEVELMLVDEEGRDLIPGHADIIRTWPEHHAAVVVDVKFGYLEVPDAAENLQTAAYSVGLFQQAEETLDAIGVAIVSPRAFGQRVTSAIYTSPQIASALAEIKRIVAACKEPKAPRHAGDWCQYCKAKVTCGEYTGQLALVQEVQTVDAIKTLSGDRLWQLKRAIKFANAIEDAVNDELRHRITEGTIYGKLKSNGSTRELFDATGAFAKLNEWLGNEGYPKMTASAFDSCRKMVFGSVEELFASITGMAKSKAKERLKEVISEFCVETPKAQSPVEAK